MELVKRLVEVATGIEPVCTALQAVASPLGHTTNARISPRADDGIRTRDPHLGKVMRYQLRYIRIRAPPLRSPVVSAVRVETLSEDRGIAKFAGQSCRDRITTIGFPPRLTAAGRGKLKRCPSSRP